MPKEYDPNKVPRTSGHLNHRKAKTKTILEVSSKYQLPINEALSDEWVHPSSVKPGTDDICSRLSHYMYDGVRLRAILQYIDELTADARRRDGENKEAITNEWECKASSRGERIPKRVWVLSSFRAQMNFLPEW